MLTNIQISLLLFNKPFKDVHSYDFISPSVIIIYNDNLKIIIIWLLVFSMTYPIDQ